MIRWDAHICLPLHPQASFAPIDQLHAAGLNYVSINVGMDMNPVSQIMSILAGYRATPAASPQRYRLVTSVADIGRARAAGQMAIGFDLEGAMPLLEQPDMVALYASLGVRQIHFAYNRNNSVADGCHDVTRGLTPLGHSTTRHPVHSTPLTGGHRLQVMPTPLRVCATHRWRPGKNWKPLCRPPA